MHSTYAWTCREDTDSIFAALAGTGYSRFNAVLNVILRSPIPPSHIPSFPSSSAGVSPPRVLARCLSLLVLATPARTRARHVQHALGQSPPSPKSAPRMAAAVFLHNAIFAVDPPSPPAATAAIIGAGHANRAPNRRGPHAHDRQLSSVSSITLQASTSDHSHPTESLIHPDHLGSSESSVYLDLLARQPTYPSNTTHLHDRASGLSLQGDAVSPRERKERHEKEVRRRLRRLRLVQRVLWIIIGECGSTFVSVVLA